MSEPVDFLEEYRRSVFEGQIRKGYREPDGTTVESKVNNGQRMGTIQIKRNMSPVATLRYNKGLLNGQCTFYIVKDTIEVVLYENDYANGWAVQSTKGDLQSLTFYEHGVTRSIITKKGNVWQEEDAVTHQISRTFEIEGTKMKEFCNGSKEYEGEFNPVYKNSKVTKTFQFGLCRDGEGSSFLNNSLYYEGYWKMGKPHGKGRLFYNTKDVYCSGEWNEGVFTFDDKSTFDYFKDEVMNRLIINEDPQPPQDIQPIQPPQPIQPIQPMQPIQLIQPIQPIQPEQPQSTQGLVIVDNSTNQPVVSNPSSTFHEPSPSPYAKQPRNPIDYIIVTIIALLALLLMLLAILICVWYIKGVDYTACTMDELQSMTFRARSLTIPSNCMNDPADLIFELSGYSRLTYIIFEDYSMRNGNELLLHDLPALKGITVGKMCFSTLDSWDSGELAWDKSRKVSITNCPELLDININMGSFIKYDVFEVKGILEKNSVNIRTPQIEIYRNW